MKSWSAGKWALVSALAVFSAAMGGQRLSLAAPERGGPSPRIVRPIDEGNLVALPGSPRPQFAAGQDRGPVASDMVLGRMELLLKRSTAQEGSLQGLLRSQQDIHSALYHHWLTPEEFGEQFGPAEEDIDKVTAWLASKGIAVTGVAKGRGSIEFSATHGQIEAAFHTELHWFATSAGRQYANVGIPQIPAALSPVVAGIGSLTSVTSKPLSHLVRQLSGHSGISASSPSYVSGASNYLAPGDFWTIYNATPTEMGGTTGKGITIGIAGRSDVAASDVAAFRSAYLGGAYSGSFQQMNNGPDPGTPTTGGDDLENALDVEWAGAVAPDAKVLLVSSLTNGADGVYLSAQYLVDNNLADVISVSYGSCESEEWGWLISYSDLWEQAAAQGITVVVAAGDNGSAGCDIDSQPAAQYGLQVNGLASSAYNVAVGGTQFVDQGGSWGPTMSSTPLPGSSAQSYIPEQVWNESSTYSTLYAGSGGASNCYFSLLGEAQDTAGCGGGWPKPDWQSGVTGIPADGARDLPDVALSASLHDGYLMTLGGRQDVVGGTSAVAPAFAGVMALVDQKAGGRQGMANYQLYALAGQEYGAPGAEKQSNLQSCNASLTQNTGNSCVFYDVTEGSNAVPCYGGTASCSAANPASNGMLTGYDAGAGYDLASGLGSINIANLVNAWSVPPLGSSPTTTSLQISPTLGIVHGTEVNISVAVAPTSGSGRPGGVVSLVVNGAAIATEALSSGSWTGPIAALPGGDYQVTAQYGGDTNFAASTSPPVHLDVAAEPSITTISVAAKDAAGNALPLTAIPYGSNVILNAVTKGQSGVGSPTNAMSFSVGGKQYYGLAAIGGRAAYTLTTLAPGTYAATATYPGDANFTESTSAEAAPFTIVAASTAVSLSSLPTANGVTPVTAVVTAATFGSAPSGSLTFFANGAQIGKAAVQAEIGAAQSWSYAMFNVPAGVLQAGTNAITAQYMGDANYASSPVSAPLTIIPNAVTITVPNPPANPSMAQEYKAGAQVSIRAILFTRFENLQVQWAAGINPASGWSSGGVTMAGNLTQPVLNAAVATWDTSSIGTAGYYTLRLSATTTNGVLTNTTYVYLEPGLLSTYWPMSIAAELYLNGSVLPPAAVPVTNSSGSTSLVFGTFGWPGGQLFETSPEGSDEASYAFSQGSFYQPAAAHLHFETGDDLIFADQHAVVVVRPDGTKDTLGPPPQLSNATFNFKFSQVVVDDVDGDSIPEVVAVGAGPGTTAWSTSAYLFAWRNNGQQLNGNFPIVLPDWDLDLEFAPVRVLVGDVDGDGKKEFVVLEGTTGTSFTPRLFAADGTAKPWNAPTIQQPYAGQMALADLDHNGKLETIVESTPYDTPPGYLHVLNPDGSERPGWPQPLSYYATGDSIAVGDLNRDGNEEIVLSHNGELSVYKSDGTLLWPTLTSSNGGFGPAVLADVNGDGYPEIVAPYWYVAQDASLPAYEVEQLRVLDRTGATIGSWTLAGEEGQEPAAPNVTAGDFLGDGKSEIASGYALFGLTTQVDALNIQVATMQMGAAVIGTGWNYNASASDWPMLHRNAGQNAVLRRVATTQTTLAYAGNLSGDGPSASFTISVAPAIQGSGMPTGTVNLIDGDQNIGSCVLTSGSCSITPVLLQGTHSLLAGYVGDRNFAVSYSDVLPYSMSLIPTSTSLAISPSGGSLNGGTEYTLTATVVSSTGSAIPSGNVVFTVGAATETVALNALGVAIYTGVAPAASGELSLEAAYQGSAPFSSSSAPTLSESIVVNPVPVLSGMSPAIATAGGAAFTMVVNGKGFVDGSTVYWGNTALTTQFAGSTELKAQVPAASIAGAGVISVSVASPAPGGGTSHDLQFEVDSAESGPTTAPSFSTTAATVSAGQAASYAVSLPPVSSVTSLNCLNLPVGASCSYSGSAGSVSIATSTSTPAGTYQVTMVFTESLAGPGSAGFLLAPFLLLPLVGLRRRLARRGSWVAASFIVFVLAGATLLCGCGGSSGAPQAVASSPTHQVSSSGLVSLTVQ